MNPYNIVTDKSIQRFEFGVDGVPQGAADSFEYIAQLRILSIISVCETAHLEIDVNSQQLKGCMPGFLLVHVFQPNEVGFDSEFTCFQAQRRSEESAMATALSAANVVTGGPPPRPLGAFRGSSGSSPAQHPAPSHATQTSSAPQQRSQSSLGSVDSIISMGGLDPPLGHSLRNLAPGDRAPGSGANYS